MSEMENTGTVTHSGFVALIGAPNAGKSTLVNRLVGAKVSIVTHKVQTTRALVRGIATHRNAQIVFVDTPGIFQPKRRLDRAMVTTAWGGAKDADLVLVLIDAERGLTGDAEAMLERRVAERTAELEAANRQLASQIGEREKVESALRQAQRLEAVGQLTSGVAHDFNNLLTVILGNVEQMRKQADDPVLKRRLAMMSEASHRGARLTAQMLAFSRQQKLEPRPVDLNDTVLSMRDLLQSTIGGSVQIAAPQLGEDLWPAMIDPTQIELVILNLAINARDAMEVGGSLTIGTANVVLGEPDAPEAPPPGEYVMVSVSDTGSGMTDDVRARAFEPFFTTKAVGKGSGLGLSQVFGLAKQSGGGLGIETDVGRGTTIKIFLPRASEAPAGHIAEAGSAPPAPVDHLVVLVVDDDDAVREVTANLLVDLGYHVIEAGSGGAALDLIERHHISAVVLDFAMPGMNGADLARELRARRPQVPILFATGYADAEALMGVGDHQIVHKPFVQAELARKLSRSFAAA